MSLTLFVFLLTLGLGSVAGVMTVKKNARQKSWLEDIETKKLVEQTSRFKTSQGNANRSTPSVGA
jgi:hypothetical protein